MYTTPSRSAGMFIRTAAACLLGIRDESHTAVFSRCRTVQHDEISTDQRFGCTGRSRDISTLRSAGSLRSAISATRMLYYRPGCTNSLLETPPTRSTPLPVLLLIWDSSSLTVKARVSRPFRAKRQARARAHAGWRKRPGGGARLLPFVMQVLVSVAVDLDVRSGEVTAQRAVTHEHVTPHYQYMVLPSTVQRIRRIFTKLKKCYC